MHVQSGRINIIFPIGMLHSTGDYIYWNTPAIYPYKYFISNGRTNKGRSKPVPKVKPWYSYIFWILYIIFHVFVPITYPKWAAAYLNMLRWKTKMILFNHEVHTSNPYGLITFIVFVYNAPIQKSWLDRYWYVRKVTNWRDCLQQTGWSSRGSNA